MSADIMYNASAMRLWNEHLARASDLLRRLHNTEPAPMTHANATFAEAYNTLHVEALKEDTDRCITNGGCPACSRALAIKIDAPVITRCGRCGEALVDVSPRGGWLDSLGEVRCPTFYGMLLHDPAHKSPLS